MVRAPPARNILPALLSIFRPLSPDILPPMWEGKLFSYILSSPSRAEERGDDGARPPPQGIRGCPLGVPAGGYWLGGARRGRAVGASAAPCSADFDPPGRTAPAGRGPRAAQRPRRSRLVAGGHADHRPRVTGQGGSRPRVLFPCPSVGGVRVFVGAIGVERSLHRGGGGGGGGTSAPGAVTSTGRRPGASEAGLAAGASFAAQLWSALGNFCPLPAGPIFLRVVGLLCLLPSRSAEPSRGWGGGAGVEGLKIQ